MLSSDSAVTPSAEVPADEPPVIRVLCVDYSIGFGGATRSMSLMLREASGISPVVVTSQKPEIRRLWYGTWPTYTFRSLINYRTRSRIRSALRKAGGPRFLHSIAEGLMSGADAVMEFANMAWLAFLLKRHRIEVLHMANGFAPREALWAASLMRVPAIVHLRGFFEPTDESALRGVRLADLVVGDSEAVTDSFVRGSGDAVPSTTIHEVVDIARFDASAEARSALRSRWSVEDDQVAVGLFGRIIPWKGQREFVLAMLEAMDRNPRLVGFLVGDASDGSSDYFRRVRELINSSEKRERFRITGYVEDVEPLYGAMDILVHASIEPEPCGMVIMEAMAAKRPVIAADAGGPRELVREDVDGHLIEPGNVSDLTRAILDLASDPEKRRAMGDAGYRRAREHFAVPVAAARLQALYRKMAAARNGGVRLPAAEPSHGGEIQ